MTSITLITGASGGIGRALARQLHTQGLRVAVVGRDAGRLADVMAWLLGTVAARVTGQVIALDGGFTTVRPLLK